MLANAIGRVDPSIVGLAHLRLPCPMCAHQVIRLFHAGDDVWGCRACVRPSPEAQVATFLSEVARAR